MNGSFVFWSHGVQRSRWEGSPLAQMEDRDELSFAVAVFMKSRPENFDTQQNNIGQCIFCVGDLFGSGKITNEGNLTGSRRPAGTLTSPTLHKFRPLKSAALPTLLRLLNAADGRVGRIDLRPEPIRGGGLG